MASGRERPPVGSTAAVGSLFAELGGRLGAAELAGAAEAEGEVVGVLEAGGVEDRSKDISVGEIGELIGELRHGHVLAIEQAAEDGIGDAWILAVGAGAFLASGAVEWVGFRHMGIGGDQGEGLDGAVFDVALHLEAVCQQRLDHVG